MIPICGDDFTVVIHDDSRCRYSEINEQPECRYLHYKTTRGRTQLSHRYAFELPKSRKLELKVEERGRL